MYKYMKKCTSKHVFLYNIAKAYMFVLKLVGPNPSVENACLAQSDGLEYGQ